MMWNKLETLEQLQQIHSESKEKPVLIFKHSTRCSTSHMTLDRLQRNWNKDEVPEVKLYYLDLLSYREISTAIANHYQVEHESPQVIIIRNGEAVFHRSHFEIDFRTISSWLNSELEN